MEKGPKKRYLHEDTKQYLQKKHTNAWKAIVQSAWIPKIEEFIGDFYFEFKKERDALNAIGKNNPEFLKKNRWSAFNSAYNRMFNIHHLDNNIFDDLKKIVWGVLNHTKLKKKEKEEKLRLKEKLKAQELTINFDAASAGIQKDQEKHKEEIKISLEEIHEISEKEKEYLYKAIDIDDILKEKSWYLKRIEENKFFTLLDLFFKKILNDTPESKNRETFIRRKANEVFGKTIRVDKALIKFLKRLLIFHKKFKENNHPNQIQLDLPNN